MLDTTYNIYFGFTYEEVIRLTAVNNIFFAIKQLREQMQQQLRRWQKRREKKKLGKNKKVGETMKRLGKK